MFSFLQSKSKILGKKLTIWTCHIFNNPSRFGWLQIAAPIPVGDLVVSSGKSWHHYLQSTVVLSIDCAFVRNNLIHTGLSQSARACKLPLSPCPRLPGSPSQEKFKNVVGLRLASDQNPSGLGSDSGWVDSNPTLFDCGKQSVVCVEY